MPFAIAVTAGRVRTGLHSCADTKYRSIRFCCSQMLNFQLCLPLTRTGTPDPYSAYSVFWHITRDWLRQAWAPFSWNRPLRRGPNRRLRAFWSLGVARCRSQEPPYIPSVLRRLKLSRASQSLSDRVALGLATHEYIKKLTI